MKLMNVLSTAFILCFTIATYAQTDRIIISEEKKGRRVVLFAENTTDEALNIFILVDAKGYRRSADKPILMDVPAKRKLPVTTLIELNPAEASYTYDLIINDQLDNTKEISFKNSVKDIERVINNKLVFFSKNDCEKCVALDNALKDKRFVFRNFNIDEDPVLYKQFIAFIQNRYSEKSEIKLPVIWNKDAVIFGYDELENLIPKLKQ